jgi:hypothetical protein
MAYIGNIAPSRFVSNRAATQFSGNGSNKVFTLEQVVTQDEDILVSVDGVIQEPSVAYVVSSGTTLTFQGSDAPSANAGNNIFVYYLASQAGTVGHPSTQGLAATSGTFSTTLSSTGNATVGGTLGVTGATTLTGATALGNTGSTVKSEGGAVTTNIAQGLIKAWNRLDGDASTLASNDSFGFNVSSLADGGVGRYTSTFTSAMGNAFYAISVTGDIGAGGRYMGIIKGTSDASKVNTVIYAPDASFDDADPTMMLVAGDLA